MKTNPTSLIICIAITIAAMVYASTPDTTGSNTVEKQLLSEARKTNELLSRINKALVDMNLEEQQEETIEQMEMMNSYLESIDEKVDKDSDTLQQINNNINNSRNSICVIEQLEDIKSALNNR